jgi:hypothetical protein
MLVKRLSPRLVSAYNSGLLTTPRYQRITSSSVGRWFMSTGSTSEKKKSSEEQSQSSAPSGEPTQDKPQAEQKETPEPTEAEVKLTDTLKKLEDVEKKRDEFKVQRPYHCVD